MTTTTPDPTFPFPRIDITHVRGDWTLTTESTLTNEEAAQLTFRAEPGQVFMGAFVKVVDAGGTRIGHLASATLIEGRCLRPNYVVCTIKLR